MFVLLWIALAVGFFFIADRLFRLMGGGTAVRGRWNWRRVAASLIAMLITGLPAWWLLDMPGQIRLSRLIQSGDYASAALPLNRPHPLVRFDGAQIVIALGLMLLVLGVHMTVWPAHWARGVTASTGSVELADSTVRRFRLYGVVILLLTLLGVVVVAVVSLRPPV